MSNCVGSIGLGLPASAVAQHGVERGDHLAHDGDKDDLGLFAGGGEALVECSEGGVVTAGAEGCHLGDVSDRHAAAIDAAMSAELATVEIVGRETDESGDRFGSMRPSSGSTAMRVKASTGPTPGIEVAPSGPTASSTLARYRKIGVSAQRLPAPAAKKRIHRNHSGAQRISTRARPLGVPPLEPSPFRPLCEG